jgi:hypothetical protein
MEWLKKSKVKSQKAKVKSQKAKVKRQKAKGKRQRAKGKKQAKVKRGTMGGVGGSWFFRCKYFPLGGVKLQAVSNTETFS